MKTHMLKINTDYYEFVVLGKKNAEVRYNDRHYETGDRLVLEEWTGSEYTGRKVSRVIIGMFRLDRFGMKDWVLLCLE